ncbi:MAG: hybrid sensor histidine kinase/response regulator [Bacteroidales bacterium]|nr:MAG: hybrid sensor histidine kinase/response regulator [Bacteroidales bacterium]
MNQDNKKQIHTILIVDDNKKNLQVLGNILHEEGYKIAIAQDGYQAVKLAEKILPGLILLDVMMPGIDGFEVCENLKSKKELKNIPVIFLTAKSETTDIIEGFNKGGVDYITKPFKKEELLVRINTHIELSNARSLLKLRAEELNNANAAKDRLFSIIAHDLKHPLADLKSLLELILFDFDSLTKDNLIKCFKEIKDSTDATYNLLQNLLQWSRKEMNNLTFEPVSFIIDDVINSTINLFKQSADKKNITLKFTRGKKHEVFADKDMVQTIIRNLVNNAIKFSYKDSSISIAVRSGNDMLEVSVKDQGRGVKEEHKAVILNNDNFITTRGTGNEKGTGVGLNLCKDFVEMNKGKLWFESEEEKGSTFYFTLPVRKRQGDSALKS